LVNSVRKSQIGLNIKKSLLLWFQTIAWYWFSNRTRQTKLI